MDEMDYREVITAFLENDIPGFQDYPDWRLRHPRDEQQGDPSNLFSGAGLNVSLCIQVSGLVLTYAILLSVFHVYRVTCYSCLRKISEATRDMEWRG